MNVKYKTTDAMAIETWKVKDSKNSRWTLQKVKVWEKKI
jgi:hypothetical protein